MNHTVRNLDLPHPPQALDNAVLDKLFRSARTHNAWLAEPVAEETLRHIVELAKMAPTGGNASPLRIAFVTTTEAKEKLKPTLMPGNVEKVMAAPVTAILAHDEAFYDHLPKLFPHRDTRPMFADNPAFAKAAAEYNGALQAGYFIIAARSLGLDCGPVGGFDRAAVDAAFFAGTQVRSHLLVNLGYGNPDLLFPRNPRLDFEDIAQIV